MCVRVCACESLGICCVVVFAENMKTVMTDTVNASVNISVCCHCSSLLPVFQERSIYFYCIRLKRSVRRLLGRCFCICYERKRGLMNSYSVLSENLHSGVECASGVGAIFSSFFCHLLYTVGGPVISYLIATQYV